MGKLRTFLSQNFRRQITNRFVKLKMTPEAQKFLSSNKKWFNIVINEANLELPRHTNLPIKEFLGEISPFINQISIKQDKEGKKELDLYLPFHVMLYILTKKIKPEKTVETGVEKGGSTYMILKAINENKKGKLWSIDIGKFFKYNGKFVASIGPLVDDDLKSEWNFVCGNAQKILESSLKKKVGKIDLFIAGQGHTYEVQKHEGKYGWEYLKNGGIFVLDRPDWNDNKFLNEFLEQHKDEVEFCQSYKEGSASDPFEFTVILKK